MMFVDAENLLEFTGFKRPSDQARFLAEKGIKFTLRRDGTIALRCKELDAYTLSGAKAPKPAWEPDFSSLDEGVVR